MDEFGAPVRGRRIAAAATIIALLGVGLSASGAIPAQAAAGSTISGAVWQDNDGDGVKDTFEKGMADVQVQAVAGDVRSDGVTTDDDGNYSITLTSDEDTWRVESWLATGDPRKQSFYPTAVAADPAAGPGKNGTAVQFVDVSTADATDVDFSYQVPATHSENNPYVYIPMMQYGPHDGERAADPGGTAIRWEAESGSLSENVPKTMQPTWNQVGATNGTTMVRGDSPNEPHTALAAAYMRRHAGFGPAGIGGIYAIRPPAGGDWSATTPEVSTYIDLADPQYNIDLGGPTATGTGPSGLRPIHAADNPTYEWKRDSEAYNMVGRSGLGMISMDADGRYLFAVNLNTRSLIRVDTGGDLTQPPVAVEEFFLGQYFHPDNDVRPYGVSVDPETGTMYLTATDTAETSYASADDAAERKAAQDQLAGYVYSFQPDDPEGTFTSVLEFPLNYQRSSDIFDYHPWQRSIDPQRAGAPEYYPEPMVTSVRILHGDMIIGVRDRTGDLFGNTTYYSPVEGDSGTIAERSQGDVLIAAKDASGDWTLESGGSVEGHGKGAGVYSGPGGGLYFNTVFHPQQFYDALGATVVNPSHDAGIMTTGVHINGSNNQEGTRRLYQDTGQHYDPYGALVRSTVDNLASFKSNGLGAATVLAESAPIEIGNYVWFDTDSDGVQDADEQPVDGATVNLYKVGADGVPVLVSSKQTSAAGEYYFSSLDEDTETVTPLEPGTAYVIAVDDPSDYAAEGVLQGWVPTTPNTGDTDSPDADSNDSDGVVDNASPFTVFPHVAVATGAAGQNNHTYDFGFNQSSLEFDKRTVSGPTESPDDDGTWDLVYELEVKNTGGRELSYSLEDDLTGYGSGIHVVSTEVLSGPEAAAESLNAAWDGDADKKVVTGQVLIAAAGTDPTVQTYRLSVTVALDKDAAGTVTAVPADLVCADPAAPGDATTGLFNQATLKPRVGSPLVDHECGDLPLVTVIKELSEGSPAVVDPVNRPGVYSVSYQVTVANSASVDTDYDLDDTFRFGEVFTVIPGSVNTSADAPVTINDGFDGASDTMIVQDEPIAGNTQHVYTVTAEVTVDIPPHLTPNPGACQESDPSTGSGLSNDARVSMNGYARLDSACAGVGDVSHTKELESVTPTGDGRWQVVYGITVNSTAAEPTSYSLSDELHFGAGITIESASVTGSPDTVTLNPTWDGQNSLTVAENVWIAGAGDAEYQPHVYQVTVVADAPSTFSTGADGVDPAACGAEPVDYENVTDRAFLNVSTLIDESGDIEHQDACAPVPHITIDKTFTSRPRVEADGSYQVEYQIAVSGVGDVGASYDLIDDLQFDASFTVTSAAVGDHPAAATVLPTWTGQGEAGSESLVVARDVPLVAGETHTYTVTVTGTVPATAMRNPTGLTCPVPDDYDATGGFHNVAVVIASGKQIAADVCAPALPPAPDPTPTPVPDPTPTSDPVPTPDPTPVPLPTLEPVPTPSPTPPPVLPVTG